jgi:serine/threonine-protein kinase
MSFGLKNPTLAMLSIVVDKAVLPEAMIELNSRAAPGRAIRRRAFFRQLKAEVLAYVGDVPGTLEALDDSEQAGLFDICWLDRCPLFDGVREEPKFKAIRVKVAARAGEVLAGLKSFTRPP